MARTSGTGALEGKVAVVSGATSGSGRAIARRYVAEGAQVVLLARGKERLDAEVEAHGPATVGIATDVTDSESVRQAFEEIGNRFGRIDILENVAAVYRPCRIEDLSDFDIERQVLTNYVGPVYTCRNALPLLRAAGSADIVNTSSESTLDPWPMLSMYVSSKAALETFTKTLGDELHDEDIRVTLVIQGSAGEGEGSTGWAWEQDKSAVAFQVWTERGYLAKTAGRPGSSGMTTDDIADVHVYIVTRPRGLKLDVIHVRNH